MKILIVNPGGLPVPAVKGGAVQTLVDTIIKENDKKNKCELFSITPFDDNAFEESKKYKKTKFIFFKVPRFYLLMDKIIYKLASLFSSHPQSYGRILKSIYYIRFLKKLLKSNNFDKVIFEHNLLLLLSLNGRKNFNKYKDKYILHIHNKIRTIKPVKKYITNCKKIFTVSNYMKNYLVNETPYNIKLENVEVLYNCIDLNLFNPNNRGKLDFMNKLNNDKIKLLFTGRLNKEKGLFEVLESFKKLDNNKYQLIIVGGLFYSSNNGKKSENKIMHNYKNYIDNNSIVFTGFIDYKFMPFIYNIADLVILPSIWDEPAGLAMLEAACCHKKIITTNSGGIPEYVSRCAVVLEKETISSTLTNAIINSNFSDLDFSFVNKFNSENYYMNFIKFVGGDNND